MRKSFSAKICLSGHSRPPSAHTALPIVSENSSQVLEAPSCQRRGTSIGWCGPPPSCALQKAPGQWLSPDWLWQGLEICT